jgi:hypothetical protein
VLTKFDDYPIQQTAEPLAYLATSDRNAYGRYFFNGIDPDGEFYFGIAFGIYPNREVMDCALSIVFKDGSQHSFRASRRLRGDRTDMRVGPLTLQVMEPMRTLRVTIDNNSTGITADLTFHARTAAHAEPLDLVRQGVRTVVQVSRYTQFGMCNGHISIGNHRQPLDPERTLSVRDRSWGWRWVGEPEIGVSHQLPEQVFALWVPIHWQDHCTHYGVLEFGGSHRSKEFANICPAHAIGTNFDTLSHDGFRQISAGEHRITFEPESRFAARAEIDLVEKGEVRSITLEPILRFHMIGLGYQHKTWGHGFYKGEEVITSEHWNINDIDLSAFEFQHVQQVVRATDGEKKGCGILEQAIFGPHERYGLVDKLAP